MQRAARAPFDAGSGKIAPALVLVLLAQVPAPARGTEALLALLRQWLILFEQSPVLSEAHAAVLALARSCGPQVLVR